MKTRELSILAFLNLGSVRKTIINCTGTGHIQCNVNRHCESCKEE